MLIYVAMCSHSVESISICLHRLVDNIGISPAKMITIC